MRLNIVAFTDTVKAFKSSDFFGQKLPGVPWSAWFDGSFPDCLLLLLCHGISMALYSDRLNLPDASDAIGTKHKSDDLGNEVIVFSALLWISKISAISARRITALHATGPNLAPRSPLIVMTPGTTSFQVRTTRATVKTTICDHGYIRSDSLHRFRSPLNKSLSKQMPIDVLCQFNYVKSIIDERAPPIILKSQY
jgi:hypothetical protein